MNVYDEDRIPLLLSRLPAVFRYIRVLAKEYVGPIFKTTRNWWSVFMVYYGVSPSSVINFKDGSSFKLNKDNYSEFIAEIESLNTMMNNPPKGVKRTGDTVTFIAANGKRVASDYRTVTAIVQEFVSGDHSPIDVSGKTVVDIGAFVGDSALYYVIEGGAAKVYAYEPVPSLYELTRSNIRLNKLQGKIIAIRAAASGKNGTTKIDDGFSQKSVTTKAVSLETIAKDCKIKNGAIKVDCEGFEYKLFRHASSKAINCFDTIHVEYHYGYKDIEERLIKEGYKVRHTKPKLAYTNMFRNRIIGGDIIATKAAK